MMDKENGNVTYDGKSLSKDIKIKRLIDLEISMDDCSKLIGISKPTLSRIENGSIPDLLTFFKVVKWLGSDANKYIINW